MASRRRNRTRNNTESNPLSMYSARATAAVSLASSRSSNGSRTNNNHNEDGGGWLATKKRGRDDARIAQDAEKAKTKRLEDYRRKRGLSSKNGAKTKNSKSTRKKKKNGYAEDSDEDDFFVGSDEDEVEYDVQDSDEDEEEEFVADSDESELDEPSSDEEVRVAPRKNNKKKPSTPTKRPNSLLFSKKKRQSPPREATSRSNGRTKFRSKSAFGHVGASDSSDDDDEDEGEEWQTPDFKRDLAKRNHKSKQSRTSPYFDGSEASSNQDDDDHDDEYEEDVHPRNNQNQRKKQRRVALLHSDDDDDSEHDKPVEDNISQEERDQIELAKRASLGMEEVLPENRASNTNSRKRQRNASLDQLVDSDEDDDNNDSNPNNEQNGASALLDDCSCEAERRAVEMALKASLSQDTPEISSSKTRKRLQKKKTASSKEGRGLFDQFAYGKNGSKNGHTTTGSSQSRKNKAKKRANDNVDDDEERSLSPSQSFSDAEEDDNNSIDEDGEGDDDDGYRDEGDDVNEEASKVLRTADTISSNVLQRMQAWCQQLPNGPDEQEEEKKESNSSIGAGGVDEAALRGMIADGALALSRLHGGGGKVGAVVENAGNGVAAADAGVNEDGSQQWITAEEMSRICPSVTLADYQLIGVNWMALLRSLTCDLKEKKQVKPSNSMAEEEKKDQDGEEDVDEESDEDYMEEDHHSKPKRSHVDDAEEKEKGNKRRGANVNGVLADEMGLGKTVQTVAFLAWIKHFHEEQKKHGARGDQPWLPHLIVVPASTLGNWEREIKKVCPSMVMLKYHGTVAERKKLQEEIRHTCLKTQRNGTSTSSAPSFDVILTTFSYFSSERGTDREFLRKIDYDYMVVDEAHCLKNPRGARYKNLDKFRTEHRLLLTGTPVQNSPKELMALLCFLMPLFNSPKESDGAEHENDGGERMLEHFISIAAMSTTDKKGGNAKTTTEIESHAFRRLKQLLAPFILRRRKCDVMGCQGLPPKIRKVEFVPFDESTRNVYDSLLSTHIKRRAEAAANKKNNTGINTDNPSKKDMAGFKHLFTALRKAANHPLLLRNRHTSEEAVEELTRHMLNLEYFGRDSTCTAQLVRKELQTFSDFDVHCAALDLIQEHNALEADLKKYTLSEEDLFCSPKFVRLRTLLPQLIEEGHRVLIFSQWTRCLDLLGCLMEYMQLRYLRLQGDTDIKTRQSLIDEFNEDPSLPVFLLSTRAGGLGINLTAADTCILHDLDFNPFNDIQAEDRCHRFGQTKQVTVYKMVTEETVDSDIYAIQERKAKMNAAIFDNENDENGSSKASSPNSEDNSNEMVSILDTAVRRYLLSSEQKKEQ